MIVGRHKDLKTILVTVQKEAMEAAEKVSVVSENFYITMNKNTDRSINIKGAFGATSEMNMLLDTGGKVKRWQKPWLNCLLLLGLK